MLALPQGAAETAPTGFFAAEIHHRMAGQELHQVLRHADRAHARAAAAVRDAEGLVQVHVAHIGADVAGPAEADLRVQVRAVHIDLPAVGVDDFADLADGFLEDAVRGRIGDHQAARSSCAPRPWRAGRPRQCCRRLSQATATTFRPAMTALAGLVPWAEVGMRQTLRWPSQRLRCQARMTSRPAYSPCEPALGCSEMPAKPVISASHSSNCWKRSGSRGPGGAARTDAGG